MAAPLGFKTFATGDVLSATDTNGYLMQGVLVFADAAARTAAITLPQEGQTSYLKDTDIIQVYSGSAWVTKSGGSPLTTKGDVYVYSTTDTRLPVGTNDYVLTADSTQATGLKWAATGASPAVGCALNNSADISIPNGTITQLTFNGELFDTNSMHSTATNTERITVPTGQGGYYLWTTKLTWNTNSTGTRQFIPYKNGTRQGAGGGPKGYDSLFDADGYTSCAVTFVIQLAAGDYVSMAAYQDSGGALDVRADELFQSLVKLGS